MFSKLLLHDLRDPTYWRHIAVGGVIPHVLVIWNFRLGGAVRYNRKFHKIKILHPKGGQQRTSFRKP
ncbi:unnamed protein product [Acanthoscelides obtectus]|uniref:Uncharacterized protein n=1 Tax=Acanthoscelides obtectus TaxID=200917 RepID=A0A9P0LC84_ACAOB|nr:unnamed protein product [Acanthoscelides obtectus]CAK1648838.1 hypothetical protein AOBTE_LOCUS15917 [Acanthoscelides obtectus]